MKQKALSLFLALSMVLTLFVVPSAAAEPTEPGMYDVQSVGMSAELTPQLANNTDVKGEQVTLYGRTTTYYPGAVRFAMAFRGEPDGMYFVQVNKGDLDKPVAGNALEGMLQGVPYVNQYTADGTGRVTCTGINAPYPNTLEEGVYTVFANSVKVATFQYYEPAPVVTEECTVTFRVVNGTWSDGQTADRTVAVTLSDGKGTLPASQVPVGMKPAAGYEGGAWDVTPVTGENGVTGDVTYTYTFQKHQPVIGKAAVTFRVVNGTWSDGQTADRTVAVTLSDGKGTLPPSQVPVGMKPAAGYEGGAWDVTPVTGENGVTGDVTYTYTFTRKPEKPAPSFPDVKTGDWFYKGVMYSAGKGFMSGLPDGTFGPKVTMTRAQLVQMLYAMQGRPDVVTTDKFSDVRAGDWFVKAVSWAVEAGVTGGVGGGQFAPNAEITRQEMAVMLYAYKGRPAAAGKLDFVDNADIASWAGNAVIWAVENGLMSSTSTAQRQFSPKNTATRAEAAIIMMNMDKLGK